MRFAHVLVVTYGRSGSTLMQGLLNSIPGCLVRGENYHFCHGLFRSYEALRRARHEHGNPGSAGDVTRPWFGASELDDELFLADARQLVLHQLVPKDGSYTCVGFKEIRYLRNDREPGHPDTSRQLIDYLGFLVRLFREPAIVLLRRDHDEVLQSGWWQNMESSRVRRRLEEFEKTCDAFASTYPNAFVVNYADMVHRTGRLNELFAFLGADYDAPRIEAVLTREHSWRTRS